MNILQSIQDQLSPELLSEIGKSVGESPQATKSALTQSLPALMGSAAAQASSPQGATSLFNLLRDHTPQAGWASSTAGLLGRVTGDSSGAGSSFVSTLLGSKFNMLRDLIASRAGVRSESASSLLGTGGNLLMSSLGKQVAAQGLGAAGFGELLRSQIPHLQGLLPADLAGKLGLGNLLNRAAAPAGAAAAASAAQVGYEPRHVRADVASTSRVLSRALVPLVLALAAILLKVYRYHRSSNTGGTADSSLTTRGEGAGNSTEAQPSQISLANLTDRLKAAIAGHDGTPVDLQGVAFDSSGTLSPAASGEVSLVGRLINNYPSLKATIAVYGKTSEEATTRANAFQEALVKTGVAPERITVKPEVGEAMPKISFQQ